MKDTQLLHEATVARQGRQFWTGPHVQAAWQHLETHPNDVCLTLYTTDTGTTPQVVKVLLGGPIPKGTLLDASNHSFADFGDSFDVGEMSSLAKAWFRDEHPDKLHDIDIQILDNGRSALLGPKAKLICLSRQTPALLDMATFETNALHNIGQYCNTQGHLGHTGDYHSTIGGVNCLHHEAPLLPHSSTAMKVFIMAGYSSKPLKAWRDSRVFWMAYDPDARQAWLVPHNLSQDAVGDHVSATMPLISKRTDDNDHNSCIRIVHLDSPVQAVLQSASPLDPHYASHASFLDRCVAAANEINWSLPEQISVSASATESKSKEHVVETSSHGDTESSISISRTMALYDGCKLTCDTMLSFPVESAGDPNTATSLSTRHGSLKVLAKGCCANSRVVVVNATSTAATSEIYSVDTLLSGVILVQMNSMDIFQDLNMVRWNTSRAPRTAVLALMPDGSCRHLLGPFPPAVTPIENYPTPVSGTPVPEETLNELIQYALSPEADEYYGPLYQSVPTVDDVTKAFLAWKDSVVDKDFSAILSEENANVDNAFTDADFTDLMEWIHMLSVSSASGVERNDLSIMLVKLLKGFVKKVADLGLQQSSFHQKDLADLALLEQWDGENMAWALSKKDELEDILKEYSVKIHLEDGLIDFAMQEQLSAAIEKRKAKLQTKIRAAKQDTATKVKKTFNAVFHPGLEALTRAIGENPRYKKFYERVINPNLSQIVLRASQSTAKASVMKKPEDIMKLFHLLGATGFVSFHVSFLKTFKAKLINQICVVDKPGKGFNDPNSFVPTNHRIADGPGDPQAAYETDIRHQFVLPIFTRLPKPLAEEEEDEEDIEDLKKMPIPLAEEDLAEYVLLRSEFILRDPEQGTKHPMWRYADWLFNQIQTLHQVPEKQAAPLVIRSLAYSIQSFMSSPAMPDQKTMETVASIIQSISFISARGSPTPHAAIDTFFNMEKTYVPLSKDLEKDPWQIEVVNILSRAVDYIRPIMSAEEYKQVRSNFQRAAANTVKRHIVHKLIEDLQEERKKNAESHEAYVARVNKEFYPAYREIIETVKMLLDADPQTFELNDELRVRIDVLYSTIVVKWAPHMRRCRSGPVRVLARALKEFSDEGEEAMQYLISRKSYLEILYDQVYHIKYESCDQVLVEEVCKIIRAKGRNPEHENHLKWLGRVDRALEEVSSYDKKMSGFSHGNQYKSLPVELMSNMLLSLKERPADDDCVTFSQVQELLGHIHIHVKKPSDLRKDIDDTDEKKQTIWEQLRGAWWMCPDVKQAPTDGDTTVKLSSAPAVAMIPAGITAASSSNILGVLGDTYHKFKVARLYSGNLQSMRHFIRENYKFHLEWFEDTIRSAGLPGHFDRDLVESNEAMAIYAVTQRLVHELVLDEADRGDRARERVYGEVWDPLTSTTVALDNIPNNTDTSGSVKLLEDDTK